MCIWGQDVFKVYIFEFFNIFLFYAVSKWCVCLFVVIGRGGEQINKIQQESGCKVQIAPGESNTGSKESSGHICSNSVHFFPRFVFPDICCLNVRDVTEFVGVVSFRQRWSSREERVSHRRPWSHPVRLGLFTSFFFFNLLCESVWCWPFDLSMQEGQNATGWHRLSGARHSPLLPRVDQWERKHAGNDHSSWESWSHHRQRRRDD